MGPATVCDRVKAFRHTRSHSRRFSVAAAFMAGQEFALLLEATATALLRVGVQYRREGEDAAFD